jgi:hypothetical protein
MLRSLVINVALAKGVAVVTAYYTWPTAGEPYIVDAPAEDIAAILEGIRTGSSDKAR